MFGETEKFGSVFRYSDLFQMRSHKLRKLSFSLVQFFCSLVSARLLQVDFHKISYWGLSETSVEKVRMRLKSDKNIRCYTNRTHSSIYIVCLFSWRYKPLWLYFHSPVAGFSLLVFEVSRSHTTTRHSRQDSPGRVINPSQRPQPDNTQHSKQTNIHASSGI